MIIKLTDSIQNKLDDIVMKPTYHLVMILVYCCQLEHIMYHVIMFVRYVTPTIIVGELITQQFID